jgi:autoinducer 2-degrading protein
MSSGAFPISLVVFVEIQEDRIPEFLQVIEEDARGSRERENGGCLAFDVLRDQAQANKFIFYEVYRDAEALEFHGTTPHFQLWKDFKASGGVISISVSKADAIFYERN